MAHGRVIVLIVIISTSLLTTPAAAVIGTESGESPKAPQASSNTVSLTQTLELTPETPGSIQVTTSADLTLKLKDFHLFVDQSAEQVELNGFVQTTAKDPVDGFDVYAWDGNTRSPSITYKLNVNNTDNRDRYQTVDAGEWAIVETPSIPYSWSASEEIEVTTVNRVAGPGVSKDGFTFLGEYSTVGANANDQRFQLVIPEAANLTEDPDAILDNIKYASDRLQVGGRDNKVIMIAAPSSNQLQWAHGGTAHDSIFWVQDSIKVDSPNNAWVHEYIHTRQNFNTTEDFEWFIEASAEYYAALYTLQQEQIGFKEFSRSLTEGHNRYGNVILTTTDHPSPAQYNKGGFVVGRTDQRIRNATNGSGSLTEIFKQLNNENKPVSNSDFLRYVDLYSTNKISSDVRSATTTSESMSMWDEKEHKQAFGWEPYEVESSKGDESDKNSDTQESIGVIIFIFVLIVINIIAYSASKVYNNLTDE